MGRAASIRRYSINEPLVSVQSCFQSSSSELLAAGFADRFNKSGGQKENRNANGSNGPLSSTVISLREIFCVILSAGRKTQFIRSQGLKTLTGCIDVGLQPIKRRHQIRAHFLCGRKWRFRKWWEELGGKPIRAMRSGSEVMRRRRPEFNDREAETTGDLDTLTLDMKEKKTRFNNCSEKKSGIYERI